MNNESGDKSSESAGFSKSRPDFQNSGFFTLLTREFSLDFSFSKKKINKFFFSQKRPKKIQLSLINEAPSIQRQPDEKD